MDATFNSAIAQYRSNFLQYSLTNQPKYKAAYEAAQQTIESILSSGPEPVPDDTKTKQEYDRAKTIQGIIMPITMAPSGVTWQYWTAGALGIVSLVLLVL
jgi:hypothetical protein